MNYMNDMNDMNDNEYCELKKNGNMYICENESRIISFEPTTSSHKIFIPQQPYLYSFSQPFLLLL